MEDAPSPLPASRVVCKVGYDACLVKNLYYHKGVFTAYLPGETPRTVFLNMGRPGFKNLELKIEKGAPPEKVFAGAAYLRNYASVFDFEPDAPYKPHTVSTFLTGLLAATASLGEYDAVRKDAVFAVRHPIDVSIPSSLSRQYPDHLWYDFTAHETLVFEVAVVGLVRQFFENENTVARSFQELSRQIRAAFGVQPTDHPARSHIALVGTTDQFEVTNHAEVAKHLEDTFGLQVTGYDVTGMAFMDVMKIMTTHSRVIMINGFHSGYAVGLMPKSMLALVTRLGVLTPARDLDSLSTAVGFRLGYVKGTFTPQPGGQTHVTIDLNTLSRVVKEVVDGSSRLLTFLPQPSFAAWVREFIPACHIAAQLRRALVLPPFGGDFSQLDFEAAVSLNSTQLPCRVLHADELEDVVPHPETNRLPLVTTAAQNSPDAAYFLKALQGLLPGKGPSPQAFVVVTAAPEVTLRNLTSLLTSFERSTLITLHEASAFFSFADPPGSRRAYTFVPRSANKDYAAVMRGVIPTPELQDLITAVLQKGANPTIPFTCLRLPRGESVLAACRTIVGDTPNNPALQKCYPSLKGVRKFLDIHQADQKLVVSSNGAHTGEFASLRDGGPVVRTQSLTKGTLTPTQNELLDLEVCVEARLFVGPVMDPLASMIMERRALRGRQSLSF